MTATVAITNRGQLHIPISFRKVLGLTVPGIVKIKVMGRKMTVESVKSKVLLMGGKYTDRAKGKAINIEKIRDFIDYSKA